MLSLTKRFIYSAMLVFTFSNAFSAPIVKGTLLKKLPKEMNLDGGELLGNGLQVEFRSFQQQKFLLTIKDEKVTDFTKLETDPEGMLSFDCELVAKDKSLHRVLALTQFHHVSKAWKIDLATGNIEPLKASKVTCKDHSERIICY